MSCLNNFSLNELMVGIARGTVVSKLAVASDSSRYLEFYLIKDDKKKLVYKVE